MGLPLRRDRHAIGEVAEGGLAELLALQQHGLGFLLFFHEQRARFGKVTTGQQFAERARAFATALLESCQRLLDLRIFACWSSYA